MKIYSEKTKQFYSSIRECSDAEKAFDEKLAKQKEAEEQKANERKLDAAKVEEAYKKYLESQKATDEFYKAFVAEKKAFIEKYKAFHLTDNNGEVSVKTSTDSLLDFFDFCTSLIPKISLIDNL